MSDEDDNDPGWACALVVVLVFPMIAASVIVDAFVLTHLWTWFLVTQFHAPAMNMAQAAGIALVVGHFRKKPSEAYGPEEAPTEKAKRHLYEWSVAIVVLPVLTLAFGWAIFHWWIS